jgi:hypothetical protein
MDPPLPVGERQRLLLSCKALIFKWTSVHFKSYLEKLDQQLLRMAEKAGTNQEQNRLLQSRTELSLIISSSTLARSGTSCNPSAADAAPPGDLSAAQRQQRRPLEKLLLGHMRDAFDAFLHHRATATDLTQADAELKLVDNDELEQSIAIASMTRKANADFAEALYALNQRLSVLGGGSRIEDLGNPVAPAVFAEGLQDTLAELLLDTHSKLVIYKVYDSVVMGKLDKLYQLLNHHLKTQGVLPHLRYQIRKDETVPLPRELAAQNSAESISRQADLMQLVQQLQRTQGPMPPLAGIALPAQYIVSHLQPLQLQTAQILAAAQSQAAVLESGYTTLPQRIHEETRNAVNGDVIEIVGLLFEYMLSDEQLPDSVKALLSYLHTPFLKIALLDQAFFSHPQHPARQLLNSLVAAGERWVEPEGKYKNDVYLQIKNVVQRVLDEFENDLRLFSQLVFDFNNYVRQHSRRVHLAEQRAMQAARGEDTLKDIRRRVELYLQQKLGNMDLPKAVHSLFYEPWANVLAFNLLRYGADTPQWHAVARVVDDILNYLQPQQTADTEHSQQQDWQLRNQIDEKLSAGFQMVGYDIESGTRLLAALHEARRDGFATPQSQAAGPAADSAIDAPRNDVPPLDAPTEALDPIIEKLNAIEFGTWFLFLANRPRKEQWEAKLAWSNPSTQHYMFVNRLGQQVAVKAGADLAADIRAGNTRILQARTPTPFFERALERIAEQLRRTQRR